MLFNDMKQSNLVVVEINVLERFVRLKRLKVDFVAENSYGNYGVIHGQTYIQTDTHTNTQHKSANAIAGRT